MKVDSKITKRILITSCEESKSVQLELFKQDYKWFTDVEYGDEDLAQQIMLKSTNMLYPIVINLYEDKTLGWTSNLNLNTRLKKEFRKLKLERLNESR